MKNKKKKLTKDGEESDESGEEKLLQCIMCNCMTIEEYLKRHIRYNHLISKEEIIDKLYNLHYPKNFVSVGTQTVDEKELRGDEALKVDDDEDLDDENAAEESCGPDQTEEVQMPRKAKEDVFLGVDHSYSCKIVDETRSELVNGKRVKQEDRQDGRPDDSDDSNLNQDEESISEKDDKYKKQHHKMSRVHGSKSVKLNNIEDLCDMSKGELKELCTNENVKDSGTREDLEDRLRKHFKKKSNLKSKKVSKLAEITEGRAVCNICGLGYNLPDSLELGPLYQYDSYVAHLHCLMFSSGLIQRGEESQGIIGFLPADIQSELNRGSKLRCVFCSEVFATVGCCQKSCTKSYHLPCGIKHGAICEYYGNFDSYCPTHRTRRVPKNRPRNYVLTDLGLIPEKVDIETGFNPDKYMHKPKRLDKEQKKRAFGSQSSKPEAKDCNRRRGDSKQMRDSESSEEEESVRTRKKIRKTHIKEEKRDTDEAGGGRRSGRRIVKKTPGSDIYRSAVEELKKILEKKEQIKVDDTFSELAGTSRKRRNVTIKKEYESDEDVNWVRPRSRRRTPRSSDSELDEVSPGVRRQKQTEKQRSNEGIVEEQSLESMNVFLKNSKNPRSICRMSDSSEDELPYPKIKRKTKYLRETTNEINQEMENMLRDEEDRSPEVNIDQLIDNLENEDREIEKSVPLRKRSSARDVMQGREGCGSDHEEEEEEEKLTESSDFEITEKESSVDSETSPKSLVKANRKKKKGVSFSENLTDVFESKNSEFFNVENLIEKSKFHKRGNRKEEETFPSCYVTVHMEDPKEEVEETHDRDSAAGEPSDDENREVSKNSDEDNPPVSSDEEDPLPQQSVSTDADFDKLFKPAEADKSEEGSYGKVEQDSDQPEGAIQEVSEEADILNRAVEEAGIVNKEYEESNSNKESKETSDHCGPFSTSPFKLLFSTIGGFGISEEDRNQSDSENLSSSLDPDEFLQKHFK